MNWGTKIAIVYSLFVILLVSAVISSSFLDFSLVRDDYYEAESEVNSRQLAVQRTKALSTPVQIKTESGQICIQFPDGIKGASGQVKLYRPSTASMDRTWALTTNDDGIHCVQTADLAGGYWRLQLDWKVGEAAYFMEEKLFLQ